MALTPRYGFSWDRLTWDSDADYRFGPDHSRNLLRISGGRMVSQYNEPRPVSQLFNTFYALLGERNYVNIYEKKFVGANWRKNWRETAKASVQVEWADRRTLQNTTNQTWINAESRVYADNVPLILEAPILVPQTEKAATLDLSFTLNPWQKYSIRNGNRSAVEGPRLALHSTTAKVFPTSTRVLPTTKE